MKKTCVFFEVADETLDTCFSLALCRKAYGPITLFAVTQDQNPLYMDTLD